MSTENKKSISKKQLVILVLLFVLLLSLIGYMLMDAGSDTPIQQADQPVETETLRQSNNVLENSNPSVLEGNATELTNSQYLDSDIDKYFIAKGAKDQIAQKAEAQNTKVLPRLPAANNGAVVSLPNLTPPSQLPRGGVSIAGINLSGPANVISGMPTQISLPPAPQNYQYLVINGIACKDNGCRASTSLGLLTKGSSIGGGNFVSEKIESVSMNGIKTDKRFISY
ncbi:MAG: hypothetical protein M1300_07430 [Epsilonproteobacteria bacterium]|nr:hypothetical protein [Campylobacterota bacterium]